MMFRKFSYIFSLLFILITVNGVAQDPSASREFKRRHFFADLAMQSYMTSMQAAAEAEEHGLHSIAHPVARVAHRIADISMSELARKALSRYTPFGLLNKQNFSVGPFSIHGKSVSKSVLDSARAGVLSAAYFRKKYGSWWPLYFGKKYFLPFVLKSVVLGAIIPPIFELTRLNRVKKWGEQSWWRYEIAAIIMGFAGSYIAQAYDYLAPRWIQPGD